MEAELLDGIDDDIRVVTDLILQMSDDDATRALAGFDFFVRILVLELLDEDGLGAKADAFRARLRA